MELDSLDSCPVESADRLPEEPSSGAFGETSDCSRREHMDDHDGRTDGSSGPSDLHWEPPEDFFWIPSEEQRPAPDSFAERRGSFCWKLPDDLPWQLDNDFFWLPTDDLREAHDGALVESHEGSATRLRTDNPWAPSEPSDELPKETLVPPLKGEDLNDRLERQPSERLVDEPTDGLRAEPLERQVPGAEGEEWLLQEPPDAGLDDLSGTLRPSQLLRPPESCLDDLSGNLRLDPLQPPDRRPDDLSGILRPSQPQPPDLRVADARPEDLRTSRPPEVLLWGRNTAGLKRGRPPDLRVEDARPDALGYGRHPAVLRRGRPPDDLQYGRCPMGLWKSRPPDLHAGKARAGDRRPDDLSGIRWLAPRTRPPDLRVEEAQTEDLWKGRPPDDCALDHREASWRRLNVRIKSDRMRA